MIFMIFLFTEEQTRMVSKIKLEKKQHCNHCQNTEKKKKEMLSLEEKYKAQKIQLIKKDSEITGHIIKNTKLRDKISEQDEKIKKLEKQRNCPEYIEVSEDEED